MNDLKLMPSNAEATFSSGCARHRGCPLARDACRQEASLTTATSIHVALLLGVVLLGCGSERATTTPKNEAAITDEEASRLGAAAGVHSPRPADCSAHCTYERDLLARETGTQPHPLFTESCQAACKAELARLQTPASPPPPHPTAQRGAAGWRALYLMGELADQSVWCIEDQRDTSPEALALVSAVAAAKTDASAMAADVAERRASELSAELARTPEGQRVRRARETLERENASSGPNSPAANEARSNVKHADEVAMATELGRQLTDAMNDAQTERQTANQAPAAIAVASAYEKHTAALRARMAAASPEAQTAMAAAFTNCLERYAQTRLPLPPN